MIECVVHALNLYNCKCILNIIPYFVLLILSLIVTWFTFETTHTPQDTTTTYCSSNDYNKEHHNHWWLRHIKLYNNRGQLGCFLQPHHKIATITRIEKQFITKNIFKMNAEKPITLLKGERLKKETMKHAVISWKSENRCRFGFVSTSQNKRKYKEFSLSHLSFLFKRNKGESMMRDFFLYQNRRLLC